MKIAQVCPYDFSRPGGVRNHILGLTGALRKLGHQVDIITPGVSTPTEREYEGVYFIGKSRSTTSRTTKVDYSIAAGSAHKQLRDLLKTEQYDIIHYHNAWTPLLSWQIRYLSFFGPGKHIATFHDTPKDGFVGKYIVSKILMPFGALIMSGLGNSGISVSKTQSRYIKKFFLRSLSIIPNGIELNEYEQNLNVIEKYSDGKFNLLFLGRIEPRKGLDYVLRAFENLKSKYIDLRLIVAGDGDGRSDAEQYVQDKQLADVEFLGFVDEETKLRLLKTADLYLAPALFGESFGIVLLESMACGTPMVGFGNEGYKNVVNGEWLEFFPEPRDEKKLTEKVEKLYNNPRLREQMVEWGREEVKKYDWDKITLEILAVYQRVLKKG